MKLSTCLVLSMFSFAFGQDQDLTANLRGNGSDLKLPLKDIDKEHRELTLAEGKRGCGSGRVPYKGCGDLTFLTDQEYNRYNLPWDGNKRGEWECSIKLFCETNSIGGHECEFDAVRTGGQCVNNVLKKCSWKGNRGHYCCKGKIGNTPNGSC